MKSRKNFLQKIAGFTLVEIMIVVTIIGILASLAVPAFQRARWKALETSVRNNMRQIWGAAQQYMLENGVDSVELDDIVLWQDKTGTMSKTGEGVTNPGYTSIIKQVADENYDAISVFVEGNAFNDSADEKESAGDEPDNKTSTMKANAIGLQLQSGEQSREKYIKLRL